MHRKEKSLAIIALNLFVSLVFPQQKTLLKLIAPCFKYATYERLAAARPAFLLTFRRKRLLLV